MKNKNIFWNCLVVLLILAFATFLSIPSKTASLIPSINAEVLNGLSQEEISLIEKSISGFSDKAKLKVEEILSRISEEERVARIKKIIVLINETNRFRKEKNLKEIFGLTPLSFLSHAEMKGLCGAKELTLDDWDYIEKSIRDTIVDENGNPPTEEELQEYLDDIKNRMIEQENEK